MRPVEIVRNDLSLNCRRSIAIGLRDAYARAAQVSNEFYQDPDIRLNTCCWIRRGFVEQMLLDLPHAHHDIAAVQITPPTFWRHVEVTGGQTLLTQLSLDADRLPPRAAYREALSYTQLLFADNPNEVLPESTVYAVLAHQRLAGEHGKVGCAVIKCAKRGMTGWYDGGINLMYEFPDVFGYTDTDIEQIDDDNWPDLLDEEETG